MPTVAPTFPINQGETFRRVFYWSAAGDPVDITGAHAVAKFAGSYEDTGPFLTLTDTGINPGLVIDSVNGSVLLTITAAQTSAISVLSGVMNIVLTLSDGSTKRLIQANFIVTPEVP